MEGKERRRRTEQSRAESERERRDKSCLIEREMEKEESQAFSRKEDLPASADREEWVWLAS